MGKPTEKELRQQADQADSLVAAVGNAQNLRFEPLSRTIFLWSDIENEAACQFGVTLMVVDQTLGPIRLVMNSCGGHSEAGLAIYDAIKTAKNRVDIDVYGACESIAAIILQAGQRRRLSRNTEFMVHDGSIQMDGWESARDLAICSKQLGNVNRQMHKLLASRSKMSEAAIRNRCRNDFYLTADQAVRLGFADEIIKETR
jgi:ATP-dependent Clp protease protease subunit